MGTAVLPPSDPLQGWMDQVISVSGPTPKGVESVTKELLRLSGSGDDHLCEMVLRIDEYILGWEMTKPTLDEKMSNPLNKLKSLVAILKSCPNISREDAEMLVKIQTFRITSDVMEWIVISMISQNGAVKSHLDGWTQYLKKMLDLHRTHPEELTVLKEAAAPIPDTIKNISLYISQTNSIDEELEKTVNDLLETADRICKTPVSVKVKKRTAVVRNQKQETVDRETIARRILTLREFDKLKTPEQIKAWIAVSTPDQVAEAFHFCAKVHDSGFWRLPFILRTVSPTLLQTLIISIEGKNIPIMSEAFKVACSEDPTWAEAFHLNLVSKLKVIKLELKSLVGICNKVPSQNATPQLLDKISETESTTALMEAYVKILCKITEKDNPNWHGPFSQMDAYLLDLMRSCRSLYKFSSEDLNSTLPSLLGKWGVKGKDELRDLGLLGPTATDETIWQVASLTLEECGIMKVTDLSSRKIYNYTLLKTYLASHL